MEPKSDIPSQINFANSVDFETWLFIVLITVQRRQLLNDHQFVTQLESQSLIIRNHHGVSAVSVTSAPGNGGILRFVSSKIHHTDLEVTHSVRIYDLLFFHALLNFHKSFGIC